MLIQEIYAGIGVVINTCYIPGRKRSLSEKNTEKTGTQKKRIQVPNCELLREKQAQVLRYPDKLIIKNIGVCSFFI